MFSDGSYVVYDKLWTPNPQPHNTNKRVLTELLFLKRHRKSSTTDNINLRNNLRSKTIIGNDTWKYTLDCIATGKGVSPAVN
jgi:hypothetical protein